MTAVAGPGLRTNKSAPSALTVQASLTHAVQVQRAPGAWVFLHCTLGKASARLRCSSFISFCTVLISCFSAFAWVAVST